MFVTSRGLFVFAGGGTGVSMSACEGRCINTWTQRCSQYQTEEEEEEEEANMVQLRVIVLGLLAAVWCFAGAAEGEIITACVNDEVKMSCAGDKKINVLYIGFDVGTTCSKGRTVPSGFQRPCIKAKYEEAMREHCHNEKSCEFTLRQELIQMFACKNKKINLQTLIFLKLDVIYGCV